MGKKKAFIDKKKAVTYSLVYCDPTEEPDDEEGGQRVLAPIGGHRGAHPASDDYNDHYDDEGSLYESEYSLAMSRGGAAAAAHHDASYTTSEERRRELLALGFPDDGYDYLQHLRDLGRGRPASAARGGVAPIPEDQELEGFEEEEEELYDEVCGDERDDDGEEDFTIYDDEPEPAGRKLDADALAAAAATAAAGPRTSSADAAAGSSGGAYGSRAGASAAAGPGPSSVRAAAAAAAGSVRGGGAGDSRARSVASRTVGARSVASTARTDGSGLGPSVFVRAKTLVAPKADVKVVDARSLVVRPKGHDEAAAAAALGEVSAMARPTELRGRRGKVYQDLDEVEKSLQAMENGNDPNRAEVVEGDEWADWLDEFVAGGGDDAGGAAARAPGGGEEDAEAEEEEAGGESEEPEEDDEEADEWRTRHRRQRQQQQQGHGQEAAEAGAAGGAGPSRAVGSLVGPGEGPVTAAGGGGGGGVAAGSVASSYWRPERRDRKQGFEALDAQFERLALEYDDEEIGDLEDERYDDDEEHDEGEDDGGEAVEVLDEAGAPGHGRGLGRGRGRGGAAPQAAAGNCELSDFADVLDEFLQEQHAVEALAAEGLRPLEATDDVAALASRPDLEALAATKARLQREMEAQAAAAAGAGDGDAAATAEPKRVIFVQEAERWDCESILSLTSNLENHPAKIVEPQRRTGGRGGGLIRLSAKTGMPVTAGAATRGSLGLGAAAAIPEEEEAEEEEGAAGSGSDDEEGPAGSVIDPAMLERPKGETAEERRARKAAVKEARRAQRSAKKEMKNMFRQQATKAQKQAAGRSLAAGSTYVIP